MTPKDLTFRLVKSLTPSEKRYFQLFASITEGEKNYLLIFDEMDKMETYEEKKIKEKYKNKKLAKNLTFEKLYLQKMILKALRNYHSTHETSYVTHYADLEILIEKGIPELLEPVLKKYKQITAEKEQWLEHLLFMRYEYKNAGRMQDSGWFEKNLEQYAKNDAYAIEQLQLTSLLKNIYNLLILVMRREKFSSLQRIRHAVEEIFTEKMYRELKDKLNTGNTFYLHIIYNTYLSLVGDQDDALAVGRKQLERIYKNRDEFKVVGLSNYLLMANNHAKNALTNGLFKEAIYHANMMYEILELKEHKKVDTFIKPNQMFYVEINVMALALSGEFKTAIAFYAENKKFLRELGSVGGREFRTVLDYYLAISEFGLGNARTTLEIIGDVKEAMKNATLSSESRYIPILYCMAHLEQDNFQYMENFLRSLKRHYQNEKVELSALQTVYKIFNEYIKYKNTASFKEKCESWLQTIHTKSSESYEHNFFRKTLLRQWLLSKYHRMPMEKITKDDNNYFRYMPQRKDAVLLYW